MRKWNEILDFVGQTLETEIDIQEFINQSLKPVPNTSTDSDKEEI